MGTEGLLLPRAVVLGTGLLYWLGVWVQTRRIRKRLGLSANARPKGLKEKLLWCGWTLVVVSWLVLPVLIGWAKWPPVWFAGPAHSLGVALGVIMMAAGYAGTLWCYVAMGDAWRMGISRNESTQLVTRGPYRYVRHPIYLCQFIMVLAIAVLLPSVFSLALVAVHISCVAIKAADEESYLRNSLGSAYAAYYNRSGRWFPRLRARHPNAGPTL